MANIATFDQEITGTGASDIIIAMEQDGGNGGELVLAGEGDDIVYGDHDAVFDHTAAGNISIATAASIDDPDFWSTKANPDVFDASVPYTTVLGTGNGEADFFAVTVGAGGTITLDLDYGAGGLGGPDVDYTIRLFDALGNEIATNDDSPITSGGLGSSLSLTGFEHDPFLSHTVVDAGIYYIKVEQYYELPVASGNVYLLNVSVTGHDSADSAGFDGDTIFGQGGDDTLYGGDFNDTLGGDAGIDTVYGGDGHDSLFGGGGSDRLFGGAGEDGLWDEEDFSDDVMTGGTGRDAYVLAANGGVTTIVENVNDGTNNVLGAGTSTTGWTINGANGTGSSVGAAVTFNGAAFSELYGSNYNDTITARAAGSILWGYDGNDSLIGSAQSDYFTDGTGDDTITGGGGIDRMDYRYDQTGVTVSLAITTVQNTNLGMDTITGVEDIFATQYNDTLIGSSGVNWLYGNYGDDVIEGMAGADYLYGMEGLHDVVSYAHAGSKVVVSLAIQYASQNTLGGGVDQFGGFEDLRGSGYGDTLTGNDDANVIEGLAGKDSINGGLGDDLLFGGAGDDMLVGGADNDTLDGGADFDIASYASAGGAVVIVLGSNGLAQLTMGAGQDTLIDIEGVIGSGFGDTLYDAAGDNSLAGGNGADYFYGNTGNDRIDGGAGVDMLDYSFFGLGGVTVNLGQTFPQATGGAGTETIISIENVTGTANGDTLTGNSAQNLLYGLAGNDMLSGGLGNDTLDGGADVDTVTFANAASAVRVRLNVATSQNTLAEGNDTFVSIENVIGSAFNDELTGSDADNVLTGGNGNDSFIGGLGNDTLVGGAGTDLASYAGNAVGVTVNLGTVLQQDTVGAGLDTMSAIENLTGTSFNDILTGSTAANVILGGNGLDSIDGNSGADTIDGGAGNDTLTGGVGDDVLTGGTGDDTLDGGTQNDTASYADATGAITVSLAVAGAQAVGGGLGSDTLIGIERLVGSGFADTLGGSSGINTITGGAGKDVMAGGGNNDRFVFLSTGDSVVGVNADRITDLSSGDIVDLSLIDAVAGGGDNAFAQVGVITGAGQFTLIFDTLSNTTTLSAETTGDLVADMQILFTGDVTGMTGAWLL